MSIEAWLYAIGVFLVIAYSAYIDTDDPLVFVFVAITWPLIVALGVPVTIGYIMRFLLRRDAK